MSPKSFVQCHQEGTEILWVQVRCLQTDRKQETGDRPGPRGDSTRSGSLKNSEHSCLRCQKTWYFIINTHNYNQECPVSYKIPMVTFKMKMPNQNLEDNSLVDQCIKILTKISNAGQEPQ